MHIAETSPGGVALFTSEGKILDVNHVMCQYLGYEKSQIVTLSSRELGLFDPDQATDLIESLTQSEGTILTQSRIKLRNGNFIDVDHRVSLLERNGDTALLAFICSCSKEKSVEISPELTQFALDNAANPTFWFKASNPVFIYVNQAACDYLEYSREELLSMTPADINPIQNSATQKNVMDRLAKQDSLLLETKHRTKSGKIVPVEVLVKMVTFKDEKYVISFVRDISARKKAEQDLQMARDSAEQANLAKSSFLANMSHEIRTPLTSIIGFADTALHDNKTTEQRIYALETIKRSGNHLLHLINDILDFSKIEAGEMDVDKQAVNLIPLLFDIEAIVCGLTEKKSLAFTIDFQFPLPQTVHTDCLRLKQIILNLVNNAIKFTDQGFVKIGVSFNRLQQKLTIQVEDSGIGLSEEQLQKLFKPFKQADTSTTRRFGGTGLGLSLSRQLANLLGGEITVTSELNQGSVFSLKINLPQSECEPQNLLSSLQESQLENRNITQQQFTRLKGKVLIAEDEALNQQLFTMYLEDMGVEVSVVENGQQAVELALNEAFDLVFMDMQMPVMSGYDAVKNLRAKNYTKPIVMLTANATLEDRKQCKEVGADDFVTKPIDEKQFYRVTANYLLSDTKA